MPYLFTTPRLGLRTWLPEDLEPLAQLCADPEVMKHFPATLSRTETAAMLKRLQGYFEKDGCTFYAVEELESGTFLGMIGLVWQTMEGVDWTPALEIGWRIRREAWGQGFATEGARACIAYAREELRFHGSENLKTHWDGQTIVAITATQNAESLRVMEKIGMHYVCTFNHPKLAEDCHVCEHVLYRLSENS